ncbi:acyl-CoA dehydrogenase family protein [Neobacillus niacini]|uniref:acyl-CoA dehydrogenase family protein n=1 Tax=Neobacillus niacini TaxID=86668 RepID=UPI0007ABD733|nr:acyl-CoA dehydrogenase family protein [Neobacillus niacini]MEC1523215.1 acyl-CoA dehydrogenase family protein [Neobacillus niacini]
MDEMEVILKESFEKILENFCDKDLLEESESKGVPKQLLDTLEEFGIYKIGIDEADGGSGFEKKHGMELAVIAGKYALPIPLTSILFSNWVSYQEKLYSKYHLSCGPFDQKITINSDKEYLVKGKIENIYGYTKGNDILVIGTNERGEDYFVLLDVSQLELQIKHNLSNEPVYSVELVNHSPKLVKPIESSVVNYYFSLQLLLNLAVATGALKKIVELTIEHANTRIQFGKQIGSFQMIKNNITIMAESVKQAEIMTRTCIESLKDEMDHQYYLELMVAKLKVCEAISTAAAIAHQIHAAMGFTQEHILHYYTRKLWSLREEYQSESYWSQEIGRFILAEETGLWELVTQ